MKKKAIDFSAERPLTLDGLLTIQKTEDGLHNIDFQCCEDVEVEPFKADFDVQGMRDGNVYGQEKKKKKRIRNRKPLYKLEDSTFSLGRDGKYYFSFRLPSAQAKDCLLYTSPSPRDKRQSRMPSSA